MAASRSCEKRGKLEVGLLFDGFRGRPAAQLVLGCIYLALLAALIGATTIADGGSLARWMVGGKPERETLQSIEFLAALLLAGGLYLPIMMLFWFAPVLVAWHAMAPPQALFYSFFASLLNWRAFLGYGMVAALVSVVIPFLVLGALLFASAGRPGFNVLTADVRAVDVPAADPVCECLCELPGRVPSRRRRLRMSVFRVTAALGPIILTVPSLMRRDSRD